MSETCLFCHIITGQEKSHVIYEDDHFIAFLDIKPLFPGHSLLLPKSHIPTFYDFPENMITPYFSLLKKLGLAIEKSMHAQGSFIAMNNKISQSVPHMHTHIVPRNPQDGLKGFFWPRTRYKNEEEMIEVTNQIKKALQE